MGWEGTLCRSQARARGYQSSVRELLLDGSWAEVLGPGLSQTSSQEKVVPSLKSRAWLFLSWVQLSQGRGWYLLKRCPTEYRRPGLTWVQHAGWSLSAFDTFKGKGQIPLLGGSKGKMVTEGGGDRSWPGGAI